MSETASNPPAQVSTRRAQMIAESEKIADPKVSPVAVAALSLGVVMVFFVVVFMMIGNTGAASDPAKLREALFASFKTDGTDYTRDRIDTASFTYNDVRYTVKVGEGKWVAEDTATPGHLIVSVQKDGEPAENFAVLATPDQSEIGWAIVPRDGVTGIEANWRPIEKPTPPGSGEPLPRVKISTNYGDIELELFEDEAPNSVANFIALIESGFYVGTKFHRIVDGFMIQGGCPYSKTEPMRAGTGDAGYKIKDEFTPNRKFDAPGLLAYANSGANTSGSQFFITVSPQPGLDDSPRGHYNLFGRVVSGMDVVYEIAKVPCRPNPGMPGEVSVPTLDVIVTGTSVVRKRNHDYKVEKIGQ